MLQLNVTTMSLERVKDIAVIQPHGDLDLAKEGLLTKTLHSLLDEQVNKVVIDLSDVGHVNYQLLFRLGQVVSLFRNRYGDVRFVGMSPYLQKIFIVAVSDLSLKRFDSLGEAVLSFDDWPRQGQALH